MTTARGLLDTNVFIHAHTTDAWAAECRAFLTALRDGRLRATLEPLVLHELSYALPRSVQQLKADRGELAAYLLMVLSWPGVEGEKATMMAAVQRWAGAPNLALVDAFLAVWADQRGCPVYTKNARELLAQGVPVPEMLPT